MNKDTIDSLTEDEFDVRKCEIEITNYDTCVLVKYKRIGAYGQDGLKSHLYPLAEKETRPIIVDFTQMKILNSNEVGVIAEAHKRALKKNNRIIVIAPEYVASVISECYNLTKAGVIVIES